MAAGAGLKVPHAGGAVLRQRDCQAAVLADQRRIHAAAVHAAGIALATLLQRALELHRNTAVSGTQLAEAFEVGAAISPAWAPPWTLRQKGDLLVVWKAISA